MFWPVKIFLRNVFTHPGTMFLACEQNNSCTTCNLFIYIRTCYDRIWQQKVGGEEMKQTKQLSLPNVVYVTLAKISMRVFL